MAKSHYIPGEWNLCCDVCNKKIKAHEARMRWDGFIVCPTDFEARHPQDFVKAKSDKITVAFTRPAYTPEYFICTLEQSRGIAGLGVAGCLVAGRITGYEK